MIAVHCSAADKDDSRNCFHALELAGQQGFPDLNNLSYAIMLRVAGTQLSCGNSVICDGPLSRLATYQQAAVLADEVGCSERWRHYPSDPIAEHVVPVSLAAVRCTTCAGRRKRVTCGTTQAGNWLRF